MVVVATRGQLDQKLVLERWNLHLKLYLYQLTKHRNYAICRQVVLNLFSELTSTIVMTVSFFQKIYTNWLHDLFWM